MALALGGGGARGYAHIGVIEVLEERGYEIVSIAGTSMGALVGGLHAAGMLEPYTEWVSRLTQRDVLRLLDPSLKAPGAIRAEKILAKVSELLDGAVIENLPVPFTAVATDLLARKEVWFQEGPVDAAIRASIALPSIITPVMINGRLLADGGLMNPIPIAATAAARADATIAVSLSGEQTVPLGRTSESETAEERPLDEWRDRVRRGAAQVFDRVGGALGNPAEQTGEEILEDVVEQIFEPLPPGLGALDVMRMALDAMQSVVTRYRLASYPPDLLMTVPKTACRTLDFHRAQEMIALGRKVAIEALDRDQPFGVEQMGSA